MDSSGVHGLRLPHSRDPGNATSEG
jgi:hypothetical protein